jgi:hypothetical protein
MRRRAQSTIIALTMLAPAAGIALVGLALLGSRVHGERAQRLADTAALAAARGRPIPQAAGAEITVERYGTGWRTTVRLRTVELHLPGLASTAVQPQAAAVARAITTSDGRPGAILVG